MEKFLKEWKKVLEADLQYVVAELREEVEPPCVLFLEGKVGSGKTTFCRLFTDQKTLSPTYSILSEADQVLHADFYRLESAEEIVHLELGLYLEGKEYFLAEWGHRYMNSLLGEVPDHFRMYKLDFLTEESSSDSRHLKLYAIDPLL